MKKNKTALITAIAVLVISLLLYFLPLNTIIGNLPFVKTFYNNTTLEIITQRSKATVLVNGKEHGETPLTIENLAEGKYTVELTRISDDETFYEPVTVNIEMARNTSARIDIEIGPKEITHGTILYYTTIPKTSENEGLLTVTSSTDDAKVYIDDEYLKKTPVSGLTLKDNQYQIKVSALGHEPVEIPIFVRKGYHLNLKTYHFPIPVNLGTVN